MRTAALVSFAFFIFSTNAYAGTNQVTQFNRSSQFYRAEISQGRRLTQEVYAARAATAIRWYLEGNVIPSHGLAPRKESFGVEEIIQAGDDEEHPYTCRRIPQTYLNKPIVGAGVLVCFTPDATLQDYGKVICDKDCLANATPISVPAQEVKEAAPRLLRQELGEQKFGKLVQVPSEAKPIWLESNGSIVGGYQVLVETREPYGRYYVYTKGESNQLAVYEKLVREARAWGTVYDPDPVKTRYPVERELNGLLNIGRLASPYVTIENEDRLPGASRMDGNYRYQPNETEFAEVQAYYALQVAIPQFVEWGFVNAPQIKVVVHFDQNYGNAFYDGEIIALGDGDGETILHPDYDNSVVTHEFGHYIVDRLSQMKTTPGVGEGSALHEGYADYLACAASGEAEPVIGRAVLSTGEPLRPCESSLSFNLRDPTKNLPGFEQYQEEHMAGTIWSGALWEVRSKLTPEVTDPLVIHSLMRIRPSGYLGTPKMEDAFEALLVADEVLYPNRDEHIEHLCLISKTFAERDMALPTWVAKIYRESCQG